MCYFQAVVLRVCLCCHDSILSVLTLCVGVVTWMCMCYGFQNVGQLTHDVNTTMHCTVWKSASSIDELL